MTIRILLAGLALSGALAFPQTKPASRAEPGGTEIKMIVTVADHASHKPTALKPDEVNIMGAAITDWRSLDSNDLELYILIDDAANYEFSPRLRDLSAFVTSQPAPVAVGLAYIHDGALQIAENPTTNHAVVARALRPPSGSKVGNPYCALADLMEQWPKKTLRREIVMVSTGIDDTAVEGAICANAETTIHDAERAMVQIYALYNPVGNYRSEAWTKVDTGVTELSHVCYETGGEAYFRGHEAADSMAPYLADISEHLGHQYLVTFRLTEETRGGFKQLFIMTGPSNPELMVPDSVWVPTTAK